MHPDKTPSSRSTWSISVLKQLYKLRHDENKTYAEIAKTIKGKSGKALERKYKRVNWDSFFSDKNNESIEPPKKWTDKEIIQLDAFLQAGKSYEFIASRINRSVCSVERKNQEMEWEIWRIGQKAAAAKAQKSNEVKDSEDIESIKQQELIDKLVTVFLDRCRYEIKRIDDILEEEFLSKINFDKSKLAIPFEELKKRAKNKLLIIGLGNPENIELEKGTYVVVGDSHGKHTKKETFALLEMINKTLKPNNIIHVGHILDDDNDISYDWGRFENLIVVSKVEELKTIQEQRNKFNFKYKIARESVNINDLSIINQDMISDYVRSPISSLDTQIFDVNKVIVNCHRLEFSSRCCNDGVSYFVSPGCLCEYHIIRTVKQIDFEDGKSIKQSNPDGFIKYRRMKHSNRYWEQGVLIIQVNKDNTYTVVPCPIKETSKGLAMSYFDKIITSSGVFKPDNKIFVNADLHCDKHDAEVLDVQEQICKDYKPDVQVNLGDTFNYSSLNHHVMDRGGVIMDKKIIDEAAHTHYVLKRIVKWAKKSYIICGNHERFASDFIEKYPQFEKYLNFDFMCDIKALGYELSPIKKALKLGSATFIHGEIRMYGQNGSKLEKTTRTFGEDTFIGHIHKPELRFGSYSIGLSGKLDQEYNEPDASNWIHGIGLCNQFMGKSFLTTIAIINNTCILNNKTYNSKNADSWNMSGYKAKISYVFE
jgi:hypothetical protein